MKNTVLILALTFATFSSTSLSNTPSAYGNCIGICVYGKSVDPMDFPQRIADDNPEPRIDKMDSEFRTQNDQHQHETETGESSIEQKPGNFLSDSIVRSNLLSGAIAKNTLLGSDLIMDDSGRQSLLASNQGIVSKSIMNSGIQASDKSDWEFLIAFYLWLVGINGTAGIGDNTVDLDVSFGDIWDNLDFALSGHVEAKKDKFGFFFDGTWIKLKIDQSTTIDPAELRQLKTRTNMKFGIFELGGSYEVGHWPFAKGAQRVPNPEPPSFMLELLAGGRLWYLDQDIDFRQAPPPFPSSAGGDKTWFDFIVGSRVFLFATENLKFWARTDIGGFGFGFSSQFSWNLIGMISYELPYRINLALGYRVFYDKYEDGSGNSRFLFDAWMHGPVAILGITF